ncbi:trypco2 family protein [Streptomyces sp. NBC_01276]|uniref:trypco2 family protein n=1 Tax=Streptomyces sp. NBC_01276 TaxID=2903808 RepID=UPI00352EA199
MIELASVIRDLREELGRAIADAEGEALRFELGPIELELTVALERSGQAGAHVRFWVVESGAEAAVSAASAQRVSLALRPALVGVDTTPFISGSADAHER